MEHFIYFLAPYKKISTDDPVQEVDEVLKSKRTKFIKIPEEVWPDISNALGDVQQKLGIILNTYEEEWVEGNSDLNTFISIVNSAIPEFPSVAPYLEEISKMASELKEKGLPLVIET